MESPRSVFGSLTAGLPLSMLWISAVSAQIVPDNTLPTPSRVDLQGQMQHITGGTAAGGNLFHSFDRFNVGTGETAYFDNTLNIENIITRVTGGQISHIDGLIRANGTANLFLLNPSGIVFGENAQLDLGGSFFGSTAESLVFENGSVYSATEPNAPPLLTINVPIGLQMGVNPGNIVNRSTSPSAFNSPVPEISFPLPPDLDFSRVGLEVRPGQTLALIGGEIQFVGGTLTASNGQIFLGSFTGESAIEWAATPLGWNFNQIPPEKVGNIALSEGSLLNTSGIGGGKIDLFGGNVTLNNSRIFALTLGNQDGRGIDIYAHQLHASGGSQIANATLSEGRGGDVNIRSTALVDLGGIGLVPYRQVLGNFLISGTFNPFNPAIVLISGTAGLGDAGDIVIDTESLLLRDGFLGGSATLGAGNAGNWTVRAHTVELVGATINNGTTRESRGLGGDITLDTERLILRDEAVLSSVTVSDATSGDILIRAADSVELRNTPVGAVAQTTIATTALGIDGKAGDITLETQRLTIWDGAGITSSNGAIIGNLLLSDAGGPSGNITIRATESVEVAGVSGVLALGGQSSSFLVSQTLNQSPGGNIDISTPHLVARDGGIISTASLNSGEAGDLNIDASWVEVAGSRGPFVSTIEASAGSAFNLLPTSGLTADAGELNLNVDRLTVRDGASVTVRASGTGSAGDLNVIADEIFLDNRGSIDASTRSGDGGNINLQVRDLQLRHASRIETDAGISNGGNIEIDARTVTALANSDISANSESSVGGRVTISAQGIFGTEFRLLPTSESDITATGGTPALNGVVELNTPEVDSTVGVLELSGEAIDVSRLISRNPCGNARKSSFTIIGRGSLPDDPRQVLHSRSIWTDWRDWRSFQSEPSETASASISSETPQLIEAQGWVRHPDGTIELVVRMPITPEIGESIPNCGELHPPPS